MNIIEAAEEIFRGHQVREIAHAAANNLEETTRAIIQRVQWAQAEKRRVICFVTGVPGAGKTLTGLSAVHDPSLREGGRPAAVFLSGNGPLVKVVRSALVRDRKGKGKRGQDAKREVSTFIQNVNQFLEQYGVKSTDVAPPEHVVVFDEAQRAWNAKQMEKKKHGAFSEPHKMLDVMERCSDWSVIVALVGGGQEIHDGEGGLAEWGNAIRERALPWEVVASPEALYGGPSVSGQSLFEKSKSPTFRVHESGEMHLNTSVRSFRAQIVSEWVKAVLDGNPERARELVRGAEEFPLALTRQLADARHWLRMRAGEEKVSGLIGLVASSSALRLRAHGLEVSSAFRQGYPFEDWFLAPGDDVRSSAQLEVAATEFECQGLELDWVGVCWGDDMTFDQKEGAWSLRRFRASKWQNVKDATNRQFALNKYRVLLTRARRGMVIWVPQGDVIDPTRDPSRLDETATYLLACGVPAMAL
ncbi:MAG: DUF2075 domain-containing protein [Acidobacteriota bacterium]